MLAGKIDAPQVAQVGEVLTVEEVDAEGKPKKWKTAPGVNITTELTQESTDTQVPSAKAAYDAIQNATDKDAVRFVAQKLTDTQKQQARENIGTIPKPSAAQPDQIIRVKSIDESGKITETEAVDMPNRLDVTASVVDGNFVVSHKFAEIKAAYDAGRVVQLIRTPASSSIPYYSFTGFSTGSIGGVAYANFRYIDYGGDVWHATIDSNNEIEFFQGAPFITLYGDVPTDTPKAITYSTANGIGYADFMKDIEVPTDEIKYMLLDDPQRIYAIPDAYDVFAAKNLVNPYILTKLSYTETLSDGAAKENGYRESTWLITDSLGQQAKATCKVTVTGWDWSELTWPSFVMLHENDALILKSSTEGSTKKFKITVNDSGTLTATELV